MGLETAEYAIPVLSALLLGQFAVSGNASEVLLNVYCLVCVVFTLWVTRGTKYAGLTRVPRIVSVIHTFHTLEKFHIPPETSPLAWLAILNLLIGEVCLWRARKIRQD